MNPLVVCTLAICLTLLPAGRSARADYDPATTRPAEVVVLNQAWHDTARDRDVPATIYYPKDAAGPCPVILFSHGLGGSNELYGYLGRCWAGHGYIAVHLDHRGSDTLAIMAGGLSKLGQTGRKIANDPQNAINRARDVSFAIDRLTALNADETWPLHGRIDLDKIGLAGHSFGGNTAFMIAGQYFGPVPGNQTYTDPRVKCAIAMSPPVVVPAEEYKASFGPVAIPMLVMTGTLDNMPISKTANEDRAAAFKFLTRAPADLVVLAGGDHMVFVGNRFGRDKPGDARDHTLVEQSTTAFFDAYLRNDDAAKKWLEQGGFAAAAGKDAEITHQ